MQHERGLRQTSGRCTKVRDSPVVPSRRRRDGWWFLARTGFTNADVYALFLNAHLATTE